MKSETVNLLIITVVVVLLAYGLGLIIVQTVDNRLSNISINMPEIKVPPANVVVRLNGSELGGLGLGGSDQQTHYQIKPKNKKIKIVTEQQGGAIPVTKMCKNDRPRHFVADVYKSKLGKLDKLPEKVEPTEEPHVKSLPARYPAAPATPLNPEQNVAGEKTYYLPLDRMTPEQKLKFKARAKFANMTLQDYINWLTLYKDDQHNLTKHNRQNLRRMLRGDILTVSDIPKDSNKIPSTAAQHYQKLTGDTNIDMTQPETTDVSINASNYDAYDQYMPPKNLKHMTHFNQDEDVKYDSPFLDPKITSTEPKEMGNMKDHNQNFQKQMPKVT